MAEELEILLNSKYPIIGIILVITVCLIKIIHVIWKIIKENKVISSTIKNKDIQEITIDKQGAILVKKVLKHGKPKRSKN